MIILSVDYGDVRTGIAVCDKMQLLASPVCVITQRNREKLCGAICGIAKDKGAQRIVVGLPKNMDSSEGFRAQACKDFARLLREKSGLDVCLQDERLTTVSAHNILNETNTRGKKRKQTVDAVAAVLILEDYLNKLKRQNTI